MYCLILLFSIISCGLSQPHSTCPEIPPLAEPFNITAFTQGKWYEIARYHADFEKDGDCTVLSFETTDKDIKFTGATNFKTRTERLQGTIDFHDGLLYMYSKGFQSTGGVLPLTILHNDYDSHIITYLCHYDENTNKKQDMSWIFSRTKTMDKATQDVVQEIFHANDIVNKNDFYWDHFTNGACLADA